MISTKCEHGVDRGKRGCPQCLGVAAQPEPPSPPRDPRLCPGCGCADGWCECPDECECAWCIEMSGGMKQRAASQGGQVSKVIVDLVEIVEQLRHRRKGQMEWLREASQAEHIKDLRYLDEGTTERTHYHLGYQSALADVLFLLTGVRESERKAGGQVRCAKNANGITI